MQRLSVQVRRSARKACKCLACKIKAFAPATGHAPASLNPPCLPAPAHLCLAIVALLAGSSGQEHLAIRLALFLGQAQHLHGPCKGHLASQARHNLALHVSNICKGAPLQLKKESQQLKADWQWQGLGCLVGEPVLICLMPCLHPHK